MSEGHVLSKDNRSYRRLLDEVADHGQLTIVVGAGASLDAGLPGWSDLVRTLLEFGLQMEKRQGTISASTPYEELAALILRHQDTLAAASIGRFMFGEQRDAQLKLALYDGHTSPPAAGRISRALADLAIAFGNRLRIITTNYDDTIERQVLAKTGQGLNVYALTDVDVTTIKHVGDDTASITHLHGYAPYDGKIVGPLVLDEKDFALSKARPPGRVLPDLISGEGPVLFVGLSMTDPNFVAACHLAQLSSAAKGAPSWFGLFVGEIENAELQAYLQKRLRSLGIFPIPLASYGQISQVLYEILYRIAQGKKYWSDTATNRYGLRIEAWRAALSQKYTCAQGGDAFEKEQRALHDGLSSLIDDLRDTVLADAHPHENLAVHLWVRHPRDRALGDLEFWGSSAHLHREAWSLQTQTVPIIGTSTLVPVKSVFYAATQRRNQANEPSRWRATMAVPIELIDHPQYPYLVVGSITLSSTLGLDRSVMATNVQAVVQALHEFGQGWLLPNSP